MDDEGFTVDISGRDGKLIKHLEFGTEEELKAFFEKFYKYKSEEEAK